MNDTTPRPLRNRRKLAFAALTVATAALLVAAWADRSAAGGATGPDVTVFELPGSFNWTSGGPTVSGHRGYSIGTTSCNQGDTPLSWCDQGGCGGGMQVEDHPVIAQNLYRLLDGRFEQIGMSWLKHGFLALAIDAPGCGDGTCDDPPQGGNQLGVGCTDPYSNSKNGGRPLGRRSEVNATTGEFPFPFGGGGSTADASNQRIRVLDIELDPNNVANAGARYFIEGHYIAADDAVAGNGLNNASYREVTPAADASRNLSTVGSTVREQPAIFAWATIDPTVELFNLDLTGKKQVQRYHLARKVTDLGGGVWRYSYALHNMNADDVARAFEVRFSDADVTFTNAGFRDIDHHSNEPYSTTDWGVAICRRAIRWATESVGQNANANALRWATMFSFWFDANHPPTSINEAIDLLEGPAIFTDGVESGDTYAWCQAVP